MSTSGINYTRAKKLILDYGITLLPPKKEIIPKGERHYFCIDCGEEIKTNSLRCPKCTSMLHRIVNRPDREQLKQLIRSTPFTIIGKQYGVSDNAVRKWCRYENLPEKVKEIKAYSDEEWENI